MIGYIQILYDATGTVLWVSDTHPPYTLDDVIGQPSWHSLLESDAAIMKGAILDVLRDGKPVTIECDTRDAGRWRVKLTPCKVKRTGEVRIAGLACKIPRQVLELTERQRQICRMLSAGLTTKEIAHQLGLARETVDNHRAAISRRLGIEPPSLVAWCGRHAEWL